MISIKPYRKSLSRTKDNSTSAGLTLFIIGWNLWFFTIFFANISPLLKDFYEAPHDILRYAYSGIVLMLLASLIAAIKGNHRAIQPKYRIWVALYAIWMCVAVLRGFYIGNEVFPILSGIVALLFPFFMYIGVNQENWKYFTKTMLFHQTAGIVFAVIFLNKFELIVRTPYETIKVITVLNYLYSTPFLIFSWNKLRLWGKFLGLCGLFATLLLGITAHFRSLILMPLLWLFGWIYVYLKFVGVTGTQKIKRGILFILLLLVVAPMFLSLFYERKDYYSKSMWLSYYRFQELEQVGIEESRIVEARDFIESEMDTISWLFGKGMGARWWYHGLERVIVHIGYINFIFIGGLPMLFLFLYHPLSTSLATIIKAKDQFRHVVAAIGILWLIELFFYGITDGSFKFIILGLSMGCLASKHKSSVDKNLGEVRM